MEKMKKFILDRVPEHNHEWISRGNTLFFILFFVLVSAGISIIPTLISSVTEEKWFMFSIMLGSYLGVVIILTKKKMNYYLRCVILCSLFMIVGFSSFYSVGLVGSGRIWFLSSAAIACLLINLKAGIIFFIISLVLKTVVEYLNDFQISIPTESGLIISIITSATFISINVFIIGAIHLIVTGLRKAEKTLAESENRFQKMLGVVPDMVSIHDKEMNILYSNWNGFGNVDKEKKKIGTKCYKTYRDLDSICSDCKAINVLNTKKPYREEVQIFDKWIDVRVLPLINEGNQVEMYMEWVRDITDHKLAEEEKSKIQAQLHHSEKLSSIGTLAAGVSHEINNPLTIVMGYIECLKNKDKDLSESERAELLERANNGCDRIANIVNGLRSYARYDTDLIENIDIHKAINDTIKIIQNMFSKENVIIETDLKGTNPQIKLNLGKLQQVIMNIFINAKDAIMEKSTTDGVIKIATEESFDKIIINISDNGIGMDEKQKANIFDPFHTTKAPGKGTGLGLSISNTIITEFGGTIKVDSKKNIGTTFIITLPKNLRKHECECLEERTLEK